MSAHKAKKKRILIVDDDISMTKVLQLSLEGTEDYVVKVENVALNAVATAKEFIPDLILLDVMMPGIDGGELAVRIQSNPKLKDIPIVFLTAAAKQEEVQSRGGTIGGFPFLAKPVDFHRVVGCIRTTLGD